MNEIKLGGIKFPKKSPKLKKQLEDFNHANHRIPHLTTTAQFRFPKASAAELEKSGAKTLKTSEPRQEKTFLFTATK